VIQDRTEELARLHFEHTPREEPSSNGHRPSGAGQLRYPKSDGEVIEKVRAERNGKFERLMRGDLSDYEGDHSSADDGFVHKLWSYTQDAEQVKRIHAMSGLHRPEKSGRRADYLSRSIGRAAKNVAWFYEWQEEAFKIGPKSASKGSQDASAGPDGVHGVLLSEVVPERVRWLWKSRIVLGKLNLVDGDPGLGKSAVTIDLAARVSAGKPWPDGSECEAGGVVILSAEDGLADTIRPRFDAAGGDPLRAVAVSTVPDAGGAGSERQIAIPDDLHVIEAEIERVGALLVIIDPLMAFMPAEVNSHRDQDVRRMLAPLSRTAERTGAAIVVVRHLNKATGGNALYRGGGSIGIVGAARSGLLVAKHPEDDNRRVLAGIKSNLAAPAPSLVFSLSSTESGAVRVDWKGETPLDASALLSAPTDHEERSALAEAQEFLREVLAGGAVPAKDAQEEARGAGIAERTLKRARSGLGVIAEREGESGQQGGGRWHWRLPEVKGATPRGWHSKPTTDRTDEENEAYIRQNSNARLRGPSSSGVKGADGLGPLNQPLSMSLHPGESATLPELKARLSVSEVGAETSRAKSGPALALGSYLEKPTEERLEWLTKAVLQIRGMDTADWRPHASVVKAAAEDPSNHPLDCGCEECA